MRTSLGKTIEKITWIPIECGLPKKEGLYLVNRYDGQYSAIICENWTGLHYGEWDGDPSLGGARDGAYPEEGPVIAWAKMPVGPLRTN